MEKKALGTSGLEITRVGVGTWAIGGPGWQFGWGPQDDNDSVAAIHGALDAGVNWIDTAAVYGLGHAEEVVGRAIDGRRDTVIVATKCGRVCGPGDTVVKGSLKAASIRAELEASLRRLRTDYIDLYQIHWPDPDADLEEGWAEISRAVAAGKVRFIGASNFSAVQLERVRAIHPVASLQPPYNMLRREIEREILPYCAARGIGVICYSPMQMGLLSGAFSLERAAALPRNDQRVRNPFFMEPALTRNLRLVEGLRPIAAECGRSVAELAVAWVLRRPEVTAAIIGARRPGQVEQVAAAAGWRLPAEVAVRVDALIAAREAEEA
jgi:aryl-alcohol dehydrogenase-like predicted oxidoreductase